MNEKWKDLPESDGAVLIQVEVKLDEYDVFAEASTWAGIKMNSIIFINADVESKTEEEAEEIVKRLTFFRRT